MASGRSAFTLFFRHGEGVFWPGKFPRPDIRRIGLRSLRNRIAYIGVSLDEARRPGVETEHVLAVMAESVTDTAHVDEKSLCQPGVSIEGAAYLGPIVLGRDDVPAVQIVDVEQLIPSDVSDILFVED